MKFIWFVVGPFAFLAVVLAYERYSLLKGRLRYRQLLDEYNAVQEERRQLTEEENEYKRSLWSGPNVDPAVSALLNLSKTNPPVIRDANQLIYDKYVEKFSERQKMLGARIEDVNLRMAELVRKYSLSVTRYDGQ